jgi:hypothetical protein
MRGEKFVLQLLTGASLAISGVVHGYLYTAGYGDIPTIGPAFLLQASVFCAVAILIALGGPAWLQVLGALGAAGSLVAFVLSRTVGLFGFIEAGWEPRPYTWISVAAELATVVLVGIMLGRRRTRRRFSADPQGRREVLGTASP